MYEISRRGGRGIFVFGCLQSGFQAVWSVLRSVVLTRTDSTMIRLNIFHRDNRSAVTTPDRLSDVLDIYDSLDETSRPGSLDGMIS